MKRTTDTLAQRLLERRLELGLTQAEVADAAGISEMAVSYWETGKTKNLRLEHLFKVADFLKVRARWLGIGDGPKFIALLLAYTVPPLLIDALRWAACVLCKIGHPTKYAVLTIPNTHRTCG